MRRVNLPADRDLIEDYRYKYIDGSEVDGPVYIIYVHDGWEPHRQCGLLADPR